MLKIPGETFCICNMSGGKKIPLIKRINSDIALLSKIKIIAFHSYDIFIYLFTFLMILH